MIIVLVRIRSLGPEWCSLAGSFDVVRRWAENPGVLAATALAAVDHQLSLGQRHPGQAARQHPDVVAAVHRERAKIDVPRPQPILDQGRHGRKLDHRLGDPASRGPR
jgi:hypothetical protein